MLRSQLPSANALFTFECVARLGSFTDAARELNVTQPAISRSVSALERHLGYELFVRHGRWIRLTPRGEKLYRSSTNAFSSISETLLRLDSRNRNRSTVTLSLSTAMVNYWLLPRLGRFREMYPLTDLQFHLNPGDVTTPPHYCDLSIGLSSPDDAGVHHRAISDEKVLAVCSPDYLSEHGSIANQRRFSGHTFIQFGDYPLNWDRFFETSGLRFPGPERQLAFSDYAAVVQAAVQGHGVALGWNSITACLLLDGSLVQASPHIVRTGRSYDIITHSPAPVRPAVDEVRNWLVEQMNTDQESLKQQLGII
ncbi:MAG TPA: LysR family transcriptional regulator [Rhizobiales bacterium]|nr:LysR family transcriptional regulator [Hyphomicrobiales bacterium]